MTIAQENNLERLWHILRVSRMIDILLVGGLVQDGELWTVERIVGNNPIYLKFKGLFLEMHSIENENGCELQWKICDRIHLPPPVYEDDLDDIEFRYVLYSIFNILAIGATGNPPELIVEKGLVFVDNADKNIIRGIDLGLSSGLVCRFDPFSFDGLQLNIFAGQPGDRTGGDKENIITKQITL